MQVNHPLQFIFCKTGCWLEWPSPWYSLIHKLTENQRCTPAIFYVNWVWFQICHKCFCYFRYFNYAFRSSSPINCNLRYSMKMCYSRSTALSLFLTPYITPQKGSSRHSNYLNNNILHLDQHTVLFSNKKKMIYHPGVYNACFVAYCFISCGSLCDRWKGSLM